MGSNISLIFIQWYGACWSQASCPGQKFNTIYFKYYTQGYGGTTTTGECARKVFQSSVLRQRLVGLCPPIYQQAMSQILLNNLTLLSLMSCDKLVDAARVGK